MNKHDLERHKKRFRKQPRQSPYGHWVHSQTGIGSDLWVYSDLGKKIGIALAEEGKAPPSFLHYLQNTAKP